MRTPVVILIVLLLTVARGGAQVINKVPLSARQTYYRIDAFLNDSSKTVDGEMFCYWINKSGDVVPDVQLHMYLNAFRSAKTTFNRESTRGSVLAGSERGAIDIISVTDGSGNDLGNSLGFISPDDGNRNDSTVLRIILQKPAAPGDTVILKIKFVSKLPSRIIRTGYSDNFFFVAQWFPKFGVYEPANMRNALSGSWNCHQFHANSEFYSNHSVYDVKITLPEKYIVGSGGLLTGENDTGDGKKILTYRAEDIVDFAWTAWPDYMVFKDKWNNVDITLLLPPSRIDQSQRQLNAVRNALEYLGRNVGPYPWTHLTFVDPPQKGEGAGGMEYTTLFTSASFAGVPEFIHLPEMVTVHEFGHAYFMGILASNEFEEPWLDEGVNSFWEARIMDHYYGKNSGLLDHPLLRIADASMSRLSYVTSPARQVVSNTEYSWNYPHGTYGMMSYFKAANWLYTLMGLVGEETMNEIFREYYKQWAFRHPSGRDFIKVANEVNSRINGNKLGPDLNWFFDQTLCGTGICDYRVAGISGSKIAPETGPDSTAMGDTPAATVDSTYRSVVELERIGEVMLPVEVLVHFDTGEEVVETWDGQSRYKDYTYTGKKQVRWVKIDPDFKIRMDVNYINNSMTTEPDRLPVRRMTAKMIAVLQFIINLFLI